MTRAWWKAAGLRALRTWAQVLVGTIPATIIISPTTDWSTAAVAAINIVGSAVLAAVISLLMSIAGLPELKQQA